MAILKRHFSEVLNRTFPFKAREFMSLIEEEYNILKRDVDFSLYSANPMDRRLDSAAMFLSTFLILETNGVMFQQLETIAKEIALESMKPKNIFYKVFRKLRFILINAGLMDKFIHKLDRRVSVLAHPDGFKAHFILKKKNENEFVFGVDILECGICKFFKKHNHMKYAAILCEVDQITTRLNGLELQRNDTIAGGALKCDFRYKKLN